MHRGNGMTSTYVCESLMSFWFVSAVPALAFVGILLFLLIDNLLVSYSQAVYRLIVHGKGSRTS